MKLLGSCDYLLLNVKSVSHLTNFIQFVEVLAHLAANLDIG